MSYPAPVYMGAFDVVKYGDVIDLYLDISADLDVGETVASVAFEVTDSAGVIVAGVVGAHSESAGRTDFRVTAPAVGSYSLSATFTISDGQVLGRVAGLVVV